MTNEEKAMDLSTYFSNVSENSIEAAYNSAIEMAEWKDKLPISELLGWHTEEPTEDGWYLVDTPNFPKRCGCIVAEWDNRVKSFYSEADDESINFNKWKLIERR